MRQSPSITQCVLAMSLAAAATHGSFGAFQFFFNKPVWEAAAGPHTTIDFVQPAPTFITNQYESLGVLFPEGDDNVGATSGLSTPDGWALFDGAGGPGTGSTITIQFTQPVFSVAFDLPGIFDYKVYASGQLLLTDVAQSPFRGIVSTQAFDTIVCYGGVTIDNLHFGPPIPAPGGLSAALIAAMAGGRRRRA